MLTVELVVGKIVTSRADEVKLIAKKCLEHIVAGSTCDQSSMIDHLQCFFLEMSSNEQYLDRMNQINREIRQAQGTMILQVSMNHSGY